MIGCEPLEGLVTCYGRISVEGRPGDSQQAPVTCGDPAPLQANMAHTHIRHSRPILALSSRSKSSEYSELFPRVRFRFGKDPEGSSKRWALAAIAHTCESVHPPLVDRHHQPSVARDHLSERGPSESHLNVRQAKSTSPLENLTDNGRLSVSSYVLSVTFQSTGRSRPIWTAGT